MQVVKREASVPETRSLAQTIDADVVVVGAGPGGASTAYHLAKAGVDVAVLEKASFPRDKICGDGLTPAAVVELLAMGIDTTGWARNDGLRVLGGGHCQEYPWPEQKTLPGYGLCRQREKLDHELILQAQKAGARLFENHTVVEAITNPQGRVTGVVARVGRAEQQQLVQANAKLVVDAGGVAARLATSLGIAKKTNRPLGVAARAYFKSPRANDNMMESHLQLWSGKPGESELLPGYGWIFALGDGTVNVGLGSVSSDATATTLPYKKVFARWVENLPEEWGLTPENQISPLRSAALPMAFNRKPHYANGLALVGDAGGMVSPFNGEGIAPAMKAGRYLADTVIQALNRSSLAAFDMAMSNYPALLDAEYGGYYSLGRIFVALIEKPKIMQACTYYGLPRKRLMKFVSKLLSDGFERSGGDAYDRLITALTKVVIKV